MPDIAGMDLFGAVTARWPSLSGRMVVMTGGAFSPEAQRFLAQVRPATLMKPFNLSELRAVLTRAAGYGQGTTVL
jgi:DNA-binding NtrC family response regulator